ncbi:MAG: DNA-deoxyinosine glycosylase, partial [Ruminiclostridium sp.]|nr:DNA-deoxyinosine glycosylase [Ruminiclostridium sp.]
MTGHTEVRHTFEPVFDDNSRILILGTMPSVKSRAGNFYY